MKILSAPLCLASLCLGLAGCAITESAKPMRQMDLSNNTVHLRLEVNETIKTIVIELDPAAAPRHVENFKKLVSEGFYKGLAFHRVIPGYLVQTGDPNSKNFRGKSKWGLGGPGYTLPAEISRPHVRGSIAMARLGDEVNPGMESNGSQFYIALAPLPQLDGKYTVFGQVVSGLEILDEMAQLPTDKNDIPTKRTEVYDMRLVRPEAAVAKPRKAQHEATAAPLDPDAGAMQKALRRFW